MKEKTCIIYDPIYTRHLTGFGHPERPQRCEAIISALNAAKLRTPENSLSPRKATKDDVILCHTKEYFDLVEHEILQLKNLGLNQGQYTLSTGDVQVSPDSFEAALYAVGGVQTGIDAVMSGQFQNGFCVVRPPGHHATIAQGMGFCLFNNVAIGARFLQKKYGIKRVLIVDWDVHHGNGTQDIFYRDPTVFYFSTHQFPLYPGTGVPEEKGEGEGKGANLNIPIAAGPRSREDVISAFSGPLQKAMENFKPEFVFISCGFDAHYLDPLGGLNLTDQDFAVLTSIMKEIASKYAQNRLLSVLEGGYSLEALASASIAHVKQLYSL